MVNDDEVVLGAVRRLISFGRVSAPAFLSGTLEAALDRRDEAAFDSEWVRIDRLVEAKNPGGDLKAKLDKLREFAFRTIYEAYEDSDLAACVSDDLELIALALIAGVEDGWLRAVLASYQNGKFPCGAIQPVAGRLSDVLHTST